MIRRISARDERGQAVAELAIVLPVLCLLLFGIIQFGIVFRDYITLTDAVRAGARKGAVSRLTGDECGAAIAQVKATAQDLDQSALTPSCTSGNTHGSDIRVTASYPYSIDIIGLVVASGRMNSTTTERLE
jgi:Flp pilus assembly protein TadG